MSIAAVIVTYMAEEEFAGNLAAIAPQADRVIIVDNGSGEEKQRWLAGLAAPHGGKVILRCNAANEGLGAAQNAGIRLALKGGAEWILLLDDDSRAGPGMVQAMLEAYRANPAWNAAGIITPHIRDMATGADYPWLIRRGRAGFRRVKPESRIANRELVSRPRNSLHESRGRKDTSHSNECHVYSGKDESYFRDMTPGTANGPLYINGLFCALASGSMVRREVFGKAGLMREDFFIDFIDWDFCARALGSGFGIMAAGRSLLEHRLGKKTLHRFLGFQVAATNHPPERRYTAARNRAIFWRMHGKHLPCAVVYTGLAALKEVWLILSFEEDKWPKFLAMLRGTRDGLGAAVPLIGGADDGFHV